MKTFRRGFTGLAGAGLILACVLLLVGCTTGTNLDGTWLVTMEVEEEELIQQVSTVQVAMIAEFSGSSFEVIMYTDTMQDDGVKGTFSIDEDAGILKITLTHEWGVEGPYWYSAPDTVNIPFTVSGDKLTMDLSEVAGEEGNGPPPELTLTKTSFTVRSELVGTWYDQDPSQGMMVIQSNGTYSWEAYEWNETEQWSGTWDASAEYLRSVMTDFTIEGEPFTDAYWGMLNPYVLQDADTLLLTIPDGEQTYTTDPPEPPM